MSSRIFQLLERAYCLPEWVIVPEVRDATGSEQRRTADAVAINCYPSKGLEIYGFEFKVARADWLRELKDGSKADAVAKHCDRWFIVAPDGIVQKAELPSTWGLIVVKDDRLQYKVPAPRLHTLLRRPMKRGFVASFVRGLLQRAEAPTKAALAEAREAGRLAEVKARDAHKENLRAAQARTESELFQAVQEFEKLSGIRIRAYDGRNVGEAFAAFRKVHDSRFWGLITQVKHLRRLADDLEALNAKLPKDLRDTTQ